MKKLSLVLEESLQTRVRPAEVALHFYGILNEAGYNDEEILQVAAALDDIACC